MMRMNLRPESTLLESICIKKFIKMKQRDLMATGHFSSLMFQAWLTFRLLRPKGKRKGV
ncbi:unnamed protein product, partial [Thlaspi arvense]